MKLDSRIIEGKRPLTCFDVEEAKAFIGKECYLSNNMSCFGDLNCSVKNKEIKKAELTRVSNTDPCYEIPGFYYDFCLPCEWVKEPEPEKKYRPYIFMEFIKEYPLGSHLRFRPKSKTIEMHRLIDGYNDCLNGSGTLFLCGSIFSMLELYDNYEIFKDGEWQPFGVIDEEGVVDESQNNFC